MAIDQAGFGICLRNNDCEDLEVLKVYRILSDAEAGQKGFIRVIDESGEDYLYPQDFFLLVDLPQAAEQKLLAIVES
jgi:hypothetical protein